MARPICANCDEWVEDGVVRDGAVYCEACVRAWQSGPTEAPMDTPSLQDTNPEGWAYITNRGGEGY